jgi:hypothetical protein
MSYEEQFRGIPMPPKPPSPWSARSTESPITDIISVCGNSDELGIAIAGHTYTPQTTPIPRPMIRPFNDISNHRNNVGV